MDKKCSYKSIFIKNIVGDITKNPGTQLTNSFHPTNEDWYYDLYVRN